VTKIDINVCRAIFNVQRIGFYRNSYSRALTAEMQKSCHALLRAQ